MARKAKRETEKALSKPIAVAIKEACSEVSGLTLPRGSKGTEGVWLDSGGFGVRICGDG